MHMTSEKNVAARNGSAVREREISPDMVRISETWSRPARAFHGKPSVDGIGQTPTQEVGNFYSILLPSGQLQSTQLNDTSLG